jgi:hypothetical protein
VARDGAHFHVTRLRLFLTQNVLPQNGVIFKKRTNLTNEALVRMNFDAQRDSLFKLLNGVS